ncbi:exonuclease domain-containing protein [Blastomonas marina]|uniref:exonuclease domain-containing protein n=1 Tax=Blastomonas marina TaxID=1867408 RepID=UPI002AC8CFF5|nr:exonuclease domain-containing protein [Blastomonas marina]WPZ03949.1 exonuclease domain-containing protein [Blastomonas marina]
MPFVFYDTETTGTSTDFDQILQFAAIKTDDDLNEIERFEIRSRLLPYVIPNPGALAVTGVRLRTLHDTNLPHHYDMMRAIEAKIQAWSPSIFIGYNTIKFDEELLRKGFFKTLQPPYPTSLNGNRRADVLTLLQAVSSLQPDALEFPTNSKGKIVLKLDQVAPANGFAHEDAHDAMGDVLATIHLAALVRERCPVIWEQFVDLSSKSIAQDFVDSEDALLLTEVYYGTPYQFIVTKIGPTPGNPSSILALDLKHDPDQLGELSHEELIKKVQSSPKPIRRVKVNACPNVCKLDHAPPHCKGDLDDQTITYRANRIQADPDLRQRIIQAVVDAAPEYEDSPYVEEQLYAGGFLSNSDEQLMRQFHQVPWEQRPAVVAQMQDARLTYHAARLMYEMHPNGLDEPSRKSVEDEMWSRAMEQEVPKNKYASLYSAHTDTLNMLEGAEGEQREILEELRVFLEGQIQTGLQRT